MAKVTDKDVINYIHEKIRYHQQEYLRFEGLLNAFTKQSFELTSDKSEDIRKSFDQRNKAQTPVGKLVVPESYSQHLKIAEKIAYALNELGEAYNEDIAKLIVEKEEAGDVKKVSQLISGVLSTLRSNGWLVAVKVGRKHKFSLVTPQLEPSNE